MAIYRFTKDALQPLTETELSVENILERNDLQRILRNQIQVLDSDLMVVTEEFDQWVESSRRIDLLCIDKQANLVVVELKRTEDGGHMELQAIRYATIFANAVRIVLASANFSKELTTPFFGLMSKVSTFDACA